jgi:uncharacterized cupin superfamily protein
MTNISRPMLLTQANLTYSGRREPPAAIVSSGQPDAEVWSENLREASSDLRYGYWVGQIGAMAVSAYPSDEYFTVLEGRVALECRDGHRVEAGPGETVLVRKGWQGSWHTLEVTRKFFVILEPAAAAE